MKPVDHGNQVSYRPCPNSKKVKVVSVSTASVATCTVNKLGIHSRLAF